MAIPKLLDVLGVENKMGKWIDLSDDKPFDKPKNEPVTVRIDWFIVYAYAEKHKLDYNELARMVNHSVGNRHERD